MANMNGFNANEVEPSSSFDPLPAGQYLVAITASEMKPTKTGNGSYLQLEFTVLDGEHKDRKVWDRFCLNHPNPQTVKIARGHLSALCRAVGVMQPRDSADLHNIPLTIKVKVKKRKDTDELTNEIKGYEPKSAASQPQAAAPSAANTRTRRRGSDNETDTALASEHEPLLAAGRTTHADQPGGPDVPHERLRPSGRGRSSKTAGSTFPTTTKVIRSGV